jgi:hypothetical protein
MQDVEDNIQKDQLNAKDINVDLLRELNLYIIGEILRKSALKELDLGFFSRSSRREV